MAADTTGTRSRRALLGGGLGAIAAVVANAFGRAMPASAANGDLMKVGGTHFGSASTSITVVSGGTFSRVFEAYHYAGGTALYAQSGTGPGVDAVSTGGPAVRAYSSGGYGLRAQSEENYAVWGSSESNYGVYGESQSSYAVIGVSDSSIGVIGLSNAGRGVYGSTGGSLSGVEGRSAGGRGGLFAGGKAQVRLEPSTAVTHPASGAAGDLFVDKSKRLWFCKGGTTWVRLDD